MSWLVAGLGNPGDRYARTRHNAGAMVVEELASRSGARFRKVRFIPVELADTREAGEPVLLAKAQQFMNVSGPAFASLAKRRGVGPDHVIACHDDIDLPFGTLQVKRGGSTAGHHGLDSLVAALRTPQFYRVRLGVGRPPGRVETHPDWLLEPFARREQADAEVLVAEAGDAVLSLIREGLAATQDRFNRRPSAPPHASRPPGGWSGRARS
jgi:peptidyl-tRNA hydrolase, PTH1 family